LPDPDSSKVGEALGSQGSIDILRELRTREGSKKYGKDKELYQQVQAVARFLTAVKSHVNTRVGLAFGKGS
jgi:hypothetical protein